MKRGPGESALAGGHDALSQVAGFVRASIEVARATDRLAKIARQQIPLAAYGLVTRTATPAEMESMRGGSQSHLEDPAWPSEGGSAFQAADAMVALQRFASNLKALDAARVGEGRRFLRGSESLSVRATGEMSEIGGPEMDSTVDARGRFFRAVQQSASRIQALRGIGSRERLEGPDGKRSSNVTLSWGDLAGRADRALGLVGRLSTEGEESSRGPGPRFERSRASFNVDRILTSTEKYMSGSRGRGWNGARGTIVAPASLSRPEFAEPMRGVYGQESRSTPGAITINSTPTVVINAGEPGDVERQVAGALRLHREELFDQLKRESVRRERAQF